MPARLIRITGRVQGVYFRSSAQEKAEALNVAGWVRNVSDGSVEIFTEGPEDALNALAEWCHHGPPASHVDHVESETAPEQHYQQFEIRKDS